MTDLGIEAWQITLLVTAAIVGVESLVSAVLRRKGSLAVTKRVRTVALSLLLALSVVVFVVALGPSLAESLSSVAAAVAALVALWLTYRSYQSPREAGRSGTGAPEAPPVPPPPAHAAPPVVSAPPPSAAPAPPASAAPAPPASAAPAPRVKPARLRSRWVRPRRRG